MDFFEGLLLKFLISANSLKPILLEKSVSMFPNTSFAIIFRLSLINSFFSDILSKLST